MTEKERLMLYIASLKMQESGVYTFKASPAEHGSVSGYFAVYEVDDSTGHKLKKGCFNDTLAQRAKTGHPYPLCYNHDHDQIIGAVTRIEERGAGLYMTAKYLNTPRAQEIRELVKRGILYQLSFQYQTIESHKMPNWDGTSTKELYKGNLYNISIVPRAAQDLALITSEKANTSQRRAELLQRIKDIEKEELMQHINEMQRADMLQRIGSMKQAGGRRSFYIGCY